MEKVIRQYHPEAEDGDKYSIGVDGNGTALDYCHTLQEGYGRTIDFDNVDGIRFETYCDRDDMHDAISEELQENIECYDLLYEEDKKVYIAYDDEYEPIKIFTEEEYKPLENKWIDENCTFSISFYDMDYQYLGATDEPLENIKEGYSYEGIPDEYLDIILDKYNEKPNPFDGEYRIDEVNYYLYSDSDDIYSAAKHMFATADTYCQGMHGYVLEDGTIILMSAGSDHNEITSLKGIEDKWQFIEMGNPSILDNNLRVGRELTSAQEEVIGRMIRCYSDDELYVSFLKGPKGDKSCQYFQPDYRRVFADIDRYYEEGIIPLGESKGNKKNLLTEGAIDNYVKRTIASSCDDYYKPYLSTSVNDLPNELLKATKQASPRSFEICSKNNEPLLHYFRYDLLTFFDIHNKKGPMEYLKGITRIACTELGMFNSQHSEGELSNFKQNILFVHNNPQLVSVQFDKDLNGLDYYSFTKLLNDARKEFNLKNRAKLGNINGSNDYKIIQVNSYEEAEKYGKYTSWCVTHSQGNYDGYTKGGNRFYFCLQNGFKQIEEKRTEGCPLDAYGLSMISVLVDLDGEPVHITTRWNHANDGEDNENLKTVEQFEQITNIDWYGNFKPYTEEERKKMGYYTLADFDLTEGEYIDLGLPSGTKWCSHNYGANNPREYGGYYKWDEAMKLPIRIPSKEQFAELIKYTESHWVSKGRIVISKTNKNSIFFPAAGYDYFCNLDGQGSDVCVWSSSLSTSNPNRAWNMVANSDGMHAYDDDRCFGFSVRGVVG